MNIVKLTKLELLGFTPEEIYQDIFNDVAAGHYWEKYNAQKASLVADVFHISKNDVLTLLSRFNEPTIDKSWNSYFKNYRLYLFSIKVKMIYNTLYIKTRNFPADIKRRLYRKSKKISANDMASLDDFEKKLLVEIENDE